ncbi:transcription factor Ouib [Drosophila bipectinata]|uniref:transcription factor Ouib n=1 Tax=Drosophila bipectinata TaxID=42026 RepID=UPI001C8ADAA5|nr:transcription factor Ouib isoform X1 [Drosophila bipectinata]
MTLQCRTCGTVIYNTKAKNLFNVENANLLLNIELVSGIPLENDPDLPSCICACCILELNQAVAFRERCIQTQKGFQQQKIASSGENSEEDDEYALEVMDELNEDDQAPIIKAEVLDDSFDEEEDEFFEMLPSSEIPDDDVASEDADTLISSVQREMGSICEGSDDFKGFTSDTDEIYDIEDGNDTDYTDNSLSKNVPPVVERRPRGRPKRGTAKPKSSNDEEPKHKKQYVTWKNLTEEEIVERKRQQRRRDCVCEQCGRKFTDQSNFKLHMLRHTGIKNFACKECGKTFYTDHLLSLHQRIVHQGEKPYSCRYCPKSFHNSTTRVIHERIHTNARPYQCKHCEKSFSSASGRKRHELIHTGVRAFSCEICDHTFQRKTHLKAHLRSKMHLLRMESSNDLPLELE